MGVVERKKRQELASNVVDGSLLVTMRYALEEQVEL